MNTLLTLLPATAALAVAIFVLVPSSPTVSEPETVDDRATADTMIGEPKLNDEYVQIGLDAGLSLEAAEEIARYVESPGEISTAEFMERIVGIAEDSLRRLRPTTKRGWSTARGNAPRLLSTTKKRAIAPESTARSISATWIWPASGFARGKMSTPRRSTTDGLRCCWPRTMGMSKWPAC